MRATCVCCKQSVNNDQRNIFDDSLIINIQESDVNTKSDEYITLKDAIEIITALKISNVKDAVLCETCFQKVESYIKLRSQLVTSLERLINNEHNFNGTSAVLRSTENVQTSSVVNTGSNKEILNTESNIFPECNNLLNNSKIVDNNTIDFLNSPRRLAYPEYNNDSESSESSDIDVSQQSISKLQENDIESEIDVCSGEADEVLELDVQCRQNEAINISSSSESEIEVCDYEPSGKKIKHYNTLSPTILFHNT